MSKLRKELGLLELVMYGVGIIVGAGIYVLIGEAAKEAGNLLWLSFLIASAIAMFTGLSYSRLSRTYPHASAEYFYVKRIFGSRVLSFFVGWLTVFITVLATSLVAIGFGNYFHNFLPVPPLLTAFLLLLALTLLNLVGIKESAKVNVLLTALVILGLSAVSLAGVKALQPEVFAEKIFSSPKGITGALSAVTIVFFAYLGFGRIATLSEEARGAEKTVPLAIMLSIVITTILYILVALGSVSILGWKRLSASRAPLADVALAEFGSVGATVISLTALFATANTVLVGLISTSRMLYGMAREKSLPSVLSFVHPGRRTPVVSVLLTGVLAISILPLRNLSVLAKATDFGAIIIFLFVNVSSLVESVKKKSVAYIITSLLGITSCVFLLFHFTLDVMLIVACGTAAGSVVYFLVHKKSRRDYGKKR